MLGRRNPQQSLLDASVMLGKEALSRMGFYGKMSVEGARLFRDEDFAGVYCPDNGRPSAPPSLLAQARVLQHFDGISDAEVIERCRFDARWKVALHLPLLTVEAPFAKSTYQAFRARLTLHKKEGVAFERSVRAAKEAGLLPAKLRVALDSSPVRGQAAVKDTFNLLSDAIQKVVLAVAQAQECPVQDVAQQLQVERHFEAPSIKGSEVVDWSSDEAVGAFLRGLLQEAERAVKRAQELNCGSVEVALLQRIIAQDVEPGSPQEPPKLRQGVAPDRLVSVHDSEMRHGRKSSGVSYNGHKGHIAVEVQSGVITAVDVTAPGEADGQQVEELLRGTAAVTQQPIEEALGDTAYSSREARRQAEQVLVPLHSKMPADRGGLYGPGAFDVSPSGEQVHCPQGLLPLRRSSDLRGSRYQWSEQDCGPCPRRLQCTTGKSRSLLVRPDHHEQRQRELWARSSQGRLHLRDRVAVEHALGRIKKRGAGRSRYRGRLKTKNQWLWTAAVVNLSLVWRRQGAAAA